MRPTKILLLLIFIFSQISCSTDGNENSNSGNATGNEPGNSPVVKVYNGFVELKTQAELNNFASKKYTTITEGLLISGNDIISTSGLESLTKVYGNLLIWNTRLTDIDGLKNINIYSLAFPQPNEILKISVLNNELLQNLDGFQGISNAVGDIDINYNTALENIDGLSNLSNISNALEIMGSDSLTNLDGLSGITNPVRKLFIWDNDALTDVSGLSNLRKITGTNSDFSF